MEDDRKLVVVFAGIRVCCILSQTNRLHPAVGRKRNRGRTFRGVNISSDKQFDGAIAVALGWNRGTPDGVALNHPIAGTGDIQLQFGTIAADIRGDIGSQFQIAGVCSRRLAPDEAEDEEGEKNNF